MLGTGKKVVINTVKKEAYNQVGNKDKQYY